MNVCLECGVQVLQTEGKRKKEYCGNTCRVKFYLKKKNKGKPKGKRGRPLKTTSKPPLPPSDDKPKDKPSKPKNIPANEPKEGSGAFYLKYGAMTYEELNKQK